MLQSKQGNYRMFWWPVCTCVWGEIDLIVHTESLKLLVVSPAAEHGLFTSSLCTSCSLHIVFSTCSPAQQIFVSRPLRSSFTSTEHSPHPHTTTAHAEVEVKWGPSHTHMDSWSSRHSQAEPPLHPRQESAISQHSHRSSLGAEPLPLSTREEPPVHPRQSSVASQHSHRSSPPPNPELAFRHQHSSSRLSRDSHDLQPSAMPATSPTTLGHTPNHYTNYGPNPQAHSTPSNTHYQETLNGLTREPPVELEPSHGLPRYPHKEDWQLRSPTKPPPHPVTDHTHSQPRPDLAPHSQRWQQRAPPSGREHVPLPAHHPYRGMEHSRHSPHRVEHSGYPSGGVEHSKHPSASREPMQYRLGAGQYGLKSVSDTALRWPHRDTEAAIPDFIPEEGGQVLPSHGHMYSGRSSPRVTPSLTM